MDGHSSHIFNSTWNTHHKTPFKNDFQESGANLLRSPTAGDLKKSYKIRLID